MSEEATQIQERVEVTCQICQKQFSGIKLSVPGLISLTSRTCPQCIEDRDRKLAQAAEERRSQEIVRSARLRDEAWEKMCPVEFRLTSESNGKTELAKLELNQPKLKQLNDWNGPKGLIIRGETGKCKTRSVWRLVRKAFVNGKRVAVLTAGEFDRQCRDAAGNFTISTWFDRLATCDVLVLDDLGNGAWTDATEATWLDLVDNRTKNGRPIIVTTQHTGTSMMEATIGQSKKEIRTEAMIRRLRDYCEQIVFT